MPKLHHMITKQARKLGVGIALNGDDTMTFTHEYSGKSFTGTDGKELIRQVQDHVKSLTNGATAPTPVKKAAKPAKAKKAAKAPKAVEGDPLATKKTLKTGRSGVMVLKYHNAYMNQGGGSGDDLDVAMRDAVLKPVKDAKNKFALDWNALEDIADRHDVWNPAYKDLNPGMARMNVSNRLRAMLRKGEKVVIRGKTIPPIVADE